MEPKNLDALLAVLNLAPSKWTLAEQIERDRLAQEKRRRWAKRRKGKGLRAWAKRRPKELAERKRKAFKARHAGEKAERRLQIERWMTKGNMGRYRPLEQVQAARRSILGLEAGRWYRRMELERVAGLDPRFAECDIEWNVDAGNLECRRVERGQPDVFGRMVAREYRLTGQRREYVPDARRRALYDLQAYAEALNG